MSRESVMFRLFVYFSALSACLADSCSGRCDQPLSSAFTCQCNTACVRYGDCCSDYYALCVQDSCSGRCGQSLDQSYNCQCNNVCERYGDCCYDYISICSSGTGGSGGSSGGSSGGGDPLSGVMQDIWNADVKRLSYSDFIINTAGNKLFTFVNETKLSTGTYAAFISLLDNYGRTIGQPEEVYQSELDENQRFLDEISRTEIFTLASAYLNTTNLIAPSHSSFRDALEKLWFRLYPRSSSNNVIDSSGFEHVMVGELKGTSQVSGFHSWIQFYLQEKVGKLRYTSMVSTAEPRMKGAAFTWYGGVKSKGSFFLGTSPEFDLVVYSICALQFPNSMCRFTLEGSQVSIQTWDIGHISGSQIGSAYPAI